MNFIKELARRGCDEQPTGRGFHAAFYPEMFVPAHSGWLRLVREHRESGLDLMEETCEKNNCGTYIGMTYLEESGDYVYLYEVDAYANRCSVAFTHKVIAEGGEKNG